MIQSGDVPGITVVFQEYGDGKDVVLINEQIRDFRNIAAGHIGQTGGEVHGLPLPPEVVQERVMEIEERVARAERHVEHLIRDLVSQEKYCVHMPRRQVGLTTPPTPEWPAP